MGDLYIKGKVVNGIKINGYMSIDRFNTASKSNIDTDSICIYLINTILKYKSVKSINNIDIRSIEHESHSRGFSLNINANVLTEKLYNINYEYNIDLDIAKIKLEVRESKLNELL